MAIISMNEMQYKEFNQLRAKLKLMVLEAVPMNENREQLLRIVDAKAQELYIAGCRNENQHQLAQAVKVIADMVR